MKMRDGIKVGGVFTIVIIGTHGRPRSRTKFRNGVTTEGLNYMTAVALAGGSQVGLWYAGLVTKENFSGFDDADLMGDHAGWEEFEDYLEGSRRLWTPGAISSGRVSNADPMEFTMSAAGVINGAFLTSDSTKGGSFGKLWAHGELELEQAVVPGERVRLYYSLATYNG